MRKLWVAALIGLLASVAHAAGIRFVNIPADASGPALRAAIWTPCASPAHEIVVGPNVMSGVRDCPVAGEKLPLIVISHGHGGTMLGHFDLAQKLADAGFIVAAINHPGDTASDMSRATEVSEFVERPVDIKRLIDFMLADAGSVDARRIGFFGFSRGGYTGLVLAGGEPDFQHADVPCPDEIPVCRDVRSGNLPRIQWTHDSRIKVYVIADPLDEFPTAATVSHVDAPIQLWASQYGGDGVLPETTPSLAGLLPAKPEYHLVKGAAHFDFLAPCSAQLAAAVPRICVEEHGFDRTAFHATFDEAVLRFFQAKLGGPSG
jgi:predicted dienelactone hydrolase